MKLVVWSVTKIKKKLVIHEHWAQYKVWIRQYLARFSQTSGCSTVDVHVGTHITQHDGVPLDGLDIVDCGYLDSGIQGLTVPSNQGQVKGRLSDISNKQDALQFYTHNQALRLSQEDMQKMPFKEDK